MAVPDIDTDLTDRKKNFTFSGKISGKTLDKLNRRDYNTHESQRKSKIFRLSIFRIR